MENIHITGLHSELIREIYQAHIEYWFDTSVAKIKLYHFIGESIVTYAGQNNIDTYSPLIDIYLNFCNERGIGGYDKKKLYRIIQFYKWMPELDFDKFKEGKTISWHKIDRIYLPKLNITAEQEKALDQSSVEILEPINQDTLRMIADVLPIMRKVLADSEIYRNCDFTPQEKQVVFRLDEIVSKINTQSVQCPKCGEQYKLHNTT